MNLPNVAAPAPTTANRPTFKEGFLNPRYEKIIHVGGAKAGIKFKKNMARKSSTMEGIGWAVRPSGAYPKVSHDYCTRNS